ncbi:hypothetical protein B5E92_08075 [Erysipelatoclostridium sp. An15]|uniref:hypothetical protein n=1 Tax=unclassified Thomasclavelia TaxID=3025756 RepID=UPI000B387FF7|nr:MULTISPECIES: hypothetical protein [unclassified Thomasclavelia]OUP77845.1 hypothetical protein B5F09_04915 [Erysipelatoclostridium sp. An173]OUQ07412.1 hypothetical protein B5E92_08075 [Erysipelatoclostridium sp. An15]
MTNKEKLWNVINQEDTLNSLKTAFENRIKPVSDEFKKVIDKCLNTKLQQDTRLIICGEPIYSKWGDFVGYDIQLQEMDFATQIAQANLILSDTSDYKKYFTLSPEKFITDFLKKYILQHTSDAIEFDEELPEICSWAKDCKYWDELAYTLICERIQQNIEFKLASKFEPCEEMNTITLKQNNEELISFGVYFDIC